MQNWPHAPCHSFNKEGAYMITAATLHKQHFFKQDCELDLLQEILFDLANRYECYLEAWSLFSNHYHFIARPPSDSNNLKKLISHFHTSSAKMLNEKHQTPGRKVWYQYWDTHLSFQNSYLARLNYVMQNPVKHQLVKCATEYKWCSAHWFEQNASKACITTVKSFKIDSVKVSDDY